MNVATVGAVGSAASGVAVLLFVAAGDAVRARAAVWAVLLFGVVLVAAMTTEAARRTR